MTDAHEKLQSMDLSAQLGTQRCIKQDQMCSTRCSSWVHSKKPQKELKLHGLMLIKFLMKGSTFLRFSNSLVSVKFLVQA